MSQIVDDIGGCFLLAILFFGVPALLRALVRGFRTDSNGIGTSGTAILDRVREAQRRGLTVKCIDDCISAEDGSSLPIKRVFISGAIVTPHANHPSSIQSAILDITESPDDPSPVFCVIPDLSNDDGVFHVSHPTTIPYQFSEVSEMPVGAIPLFALVGPKKGLRKLRLFVYFADPDDDTRVFAQGSAVFTFEQEVAGYVEIRERTKKHERQIASLALAISASDGHIDDRERSVIRRFFSERFADLDDGGERRQKVTEALQDTLKTLKGRRQDAKALIASLCHELRSDANADVVQAAYRLCVQVVAADKTVDPREQEALDYIARNLSLPPEFVREVHDHNISVTMAGKVGDEALIGMPAGLSPEQRIRFLNDEFRKWRSRATSKDPQIATEASMRLERIARMRSQLNET